MLSLISSIALAATADAYFQAIGSHSTDFRVHQREVTITDDGKIGFNGSTIFHFSIAENGTITGDNDNLSGQLALQEDNSLKLQPASDNHFTLNKTVLELDLHNNFVACIDDSLIYYTGADGKTLPNCKVTTGVGIIGLDFDDNSVNSATTGYTGESSTAPATSASTAVAEQTAAGTSVASANGAAKNCLIAGAAGALAAALL